MTARPQATPRPCHGAVPRPTPGRHDDSTSRALTTAAMAASLTSRARRLRAQAREVNAVLASAYKRRAAELSLEAWLRAIHAAPVGIDEFTAVAA